MITTKYSHTCIYIGSYEHFLNWKQLSRSSDLRLPRLWWNVCHLCLSPSILNFLLQNLSLSSETVSLSCSLSFLASSSVLISSHPICHCCSNRWVLSQWIGVFLSPLSFPCPFLSSLCSSIREGLWEISTRFFDSNHLLIKGFEFHKLSHVIKWGRWSWRWSWR